MRVIIEFIPIVLLLLLLTYSKTFINVSKTYLGKLFAVIIIIFYARFDKYVGLLVCTLIILYYQKIDTLKENMDMNEDLDEIESDAAELEAIQENKNIELEKEKMESKQKSEEQQIQLEKDKLENEKQKQEMDAERLSRAEKCDRAETMSRNKNLSKEMREKIDNVLLKCLDVETFTVKKMNAKLSTEQLLIPTNTRNI